MEVHPVYDPNTGYPARLAAGVFPAVSLVAPTTYVLVGARFYCYDTALGIPTGRIGEYVKIAASVGGMSQGY
jgi:hypothetical protein